MTMDVALFSSLNAWAPGPLGSALAWVTHLGSAPAAGLLVAAVAIFARARLNRHQLVWIAMAGIFIGVAVQVLKTGVARPRPLAQLGPDAVVVLGQALKARSFPSGHSATAAWAAGAIVWIWPRWWVVVPCVLGALLVGISRVVVGAHFPSDVVFGLFLGGATMPIFHAMAQKSANRRRGQSDGQMANPGSGERAEENP
jgi:membrane-associated phospholipid phosphatase